MRDNVLIAVPTFETITPDTFKALWDMEKPCPCDFEFVRGYDVATARNRIVSLALAGPYSHVLMVDNDVTPPRDALVNLLGDRVDVALGYYPHRGPANDYTGRSCVCKLKRPDGWYYACYPLESEYTADELLELREDGMYLVEIHGGGMGCALISIDVFMKLDYPYYDWVNYNDEKRQTLSEDLYFCEKCHGEDIPIHTDTRVSCGHMMRRIFTMG